MKIIPVKNKKGVEVHYFKKETNIYVGAGFVKGVVNILRIFITIFEETILKNIIINFI